MELSLSGPGIPEDALKLIAALTDRARLDPQELTDKDDEGQLDLPLLRYPLIEQRSVRPNVHDLEHPRRCLLTLRQVQNITIDDQRPPGYSDPITLLFGLQIKPSVVFLSSAEEHSGQTLFQAEIEIERIDLTLRDV